MRSKGKITSWNEAKGFGFITPLAGGKRVFVHVTALSNRQRRPELDELVTFAVTRDKQGRPCAARVTFAGERLPGDVKAGRGAWPLLGTGLFMGAVGMAVVAAWLPSAILGLYVAISVVTFVVYAMDKSAARRGAWRTRESTLHLLSLAGGWPGAVFAQHSLRHKSRKQAFRSVFRVTVFLNCGAVVWLLTPAGAEMLGTVMSGLS